MDGQNASPAGVRRWQAWVLYGPCAALQFLTVLPPIVRRPFSESELGLAVGYFPLVGVLVGGLLAALDLVLVRVFPVGVAAALVVAIWVLASGALHLDGLLDACDGLFGGRTPESRLRIMRDERVGAFGLAGGVLLLLTKVAAVEALLAHPLALVLSATLGRWAMALVVVGFPYGRITGLGRTMKDNASWQTLLLATAIALLAAVLTGGWCGLAAMALTGVVAWVAGVWVARRLPGLTGDIYGAACEICELVVLVSLTAVWWA
jgi:adenosylcobinamide-GDP ribazoletransferase